MTETVFHHIVPPLKAGLAAAVLVTAGCSAMNAPSTGSMQVSRPRAA
jgi:hypothetical protein